MKKYLYIFIFVLLISIVLILKLNDNFYGKYYRVFGTSREYIEFTKDNKFSYKDSNGIIEEYNCNTYTYDESTDIITLNCLGGNKELRLVEKTKSSITIKFHNTERTFKKVNE